MLQQLCLLFFYETTPLNWIYSFACSLICYLIDMYNLLHYMEGVGQKQNDVIWCQRLTLLPPSISSDPLMDFKFLNFSIFHFSTILSVQCAEEDTPAKKKSNIAIGTFRIRQVLCLSKYCFVWFFSKLYLKWTKVIQCFVIVTLITIAIAWICNIANIQNKTSVNLSYCH